MQRGAAVVVGGADICAMQPSQLERGHVVVLAGKVHDLQPCGVAGVQVGIVMEQQGNARSVAADSSPGCVRGYDCQRERVMFRSVPARWDPHQCSGVCPKLVRAL